MTDTAPKPKLAAYYGATAITEEDLQADFEATIDRCVAGETFVLLRGGKPIAYMVPYDEYMTLKKQEEEEILRAAVQATRQSRPEESQASASDSLASIADAVADGEPE